jgi:Flp pilus assembly protein TadG
MALPIKLHRRLGDRGGTVVEFALVAPMFIFLIIGILELGYMVFIQSILDWGTRDAARLVRTGQVQTTGNALTAFTNRLCGDISPMIPCSSVIIQSQIFGSWSSAQSTTTQPTTVNPTTHQMESAGFNPGTGQQICVVQVAYTYNWMTSWLGPINTSAFLISTVAFKNEPFPAPPS